MNRRELMLLLGTAMTVSRTLRAQQKAMPVIGFLRIASPGPYAPFVAAFREGLSNTGYVEGQNVAIEYRWAEGHLDRLPALAADLVARKVEVIAAGSTTAIRAAKSATSMIPIVFIGGGDPVRNGLIASLAKPGNNLTGVSIMASELMPKRLELLSDLVPQSKLVALLVNPNNPIAERIMQDVQEAAHVKGMQLQVLRTGDESEIDTAFATVAELDARGLVVGADAVFDYRRKQLVALAARHAVPTVYFAREFVAAGGLISYGTSLTAAYHQAGIYVGKVLNGAKPAELPVQQPTRFELVVNLNTAKALGLTIPYTVLLRADEVIE